MPSQTAPLFEQLDTWMNELQEIKVASAPKKAGASGKNKQTGRSKKAAPAGMGETDHPSEGVDNNTEDAPEGARYRENSEDIKKDVPANVEEASTESDEDKVMPNIGTQQSATGEDPSVENDYKGDKDDGETEHPADAEDVGEKYSSIRVDKLLKLAEDKANSILADIGNGFFNSGQPINIKSAKAKAGTPNDVATGYAAAATAGQNGDAAQLQKTAADFVEQLIVEADFDADLVGSYMNGWRQKMADGDNDGDDVGQDPSAMPPEGAMPPGMPPEAGGGGPPMGGMPPGGPGGMPPEAGGMPPGGPGGGMPPEAGGMPPEAGGGGGDPMAALNAATAEGQPSQTDKHQALQDLMMALEELGITPQELAELSQQGGGQPAEGEKLASVALAFKRAGKFKFREPKTAQERRRVDTFKNYVMEVAGLK